MYLSWNIEVGRYKVDTGSCCCGFSKELTVVATVAENGYVKSRRFLLYQSRLNRF